jgi:hypothetical protein
MSSRDSEPLVFVCYALERDQLDLLRHRFSHVRRGIENAGCRSYFHVHDGQGWNLNGARVRDVLEEVFAIISNADFVLLDLTAKSGSRRTGLNIEAGYARALHKPIAALWHESDRPNMTTELASVEAAYAEEGEIAAVVERLIRSLKSA